MPTHEFHCGSCGHHFDIFLKVVGRGLPKKCPECGDKKEFEQILGCPSFIMNNITTIGKQAEVNSKKFGKEQCEILSKQDLHKRKKKFSGHLPEGATVIDKSDVNVEEIPWYREGDTKPLDISKIKDVNKYIMTGKK